MASSVLVTTLDRRDAFHQSAPAGGVTLQALSGSALPKITTLVNIVEAQACALGYADSFWFIGALTICSIPFVLLLQPRKTSQPRT